MQSSKTLQGANWNLDRDACILSITLFNYSNALNTTQPLLLKKKLLEIPPNSSTIPWIIADLACTVSQNEQRSVWLGDVQNRNSMRDHTISTPVYLVPPRLSAQLWVIPQILWRFVNCQTCQWWARGRQQCSEWFCGEEYNYKGVDIINVWLKKKKLLYYLGA